MLADVHRPFLDFYGITKATFLKPHPPERLRRRSSFRNRLSCGSHTPVSRFDNGSAASYRDSAGEAGRSVTVLPIPCAGSNGEARGF